ncbi:MAG: hypothetical protein II817_08915 [Bacteroidales bacterium]|nr:hypothetical protein [Bacteroidales bacterium]
MKRLSTLLIAIALVLGMTQCKKKVETIATGNLGEPVYITLNVDGGKHTVYPGTGAVVYTEGDKIYVGNDGKYIGVLEYEDGAFGGTIYSPSTSDYLHFYFVGGLTPSATPSAGSTTSFTVNIADQSSQLPVLSYAHSTNKYTDGTATYSCTLLNKCGLVKFVPSTATSNAVTVGGMKTTATIDFATPGITPTATTGTVTLYSESTSAKWAILLPQNAVSDPTVTISSFNSTITSVPAITENMYYTTGVSIAMVVKEGVLGGSFTVNSSGDKVNFSQGNLQYVGSNGTWQFAEHQYDYLGTTTSQNGTSTTVTRDLFGWGTSGWNNGNYFNQPYNTSNSTSSPYTSSNGYGYGPTNGSTYTYSLTGDYANADWGHNPITNGGNTADLWRTLTKDEWVWILGPSSSPNPGTNCRTSSTVNGTANARFTYAKINNTYKGMIIFPDTYTAGTPTGVTWGTINSYSDYTTICTTAGWEALEEAGCVFLPAAGRRGGTSVSDVGSYGVYWSSTANGTGNAYSLYFDSSYFNPSNSYRRCSGYSVRLVFAE